MGSALQMVQSSSPNYVLLGSLDGARWQPGVTVEGDVVASAPGGLVPIVLALDHSIQQRADWTFSPGNRTVFLPEQMQ